MNHAIKHFKKLWQFVLPIMLVFMLASAGACQKLPRTLGLDIADYQDNPVIFNVWVNDRPFIMSRMRGRNTTMNYPPYSKNDPSIHIKMEWVEIVSNKSYAFETKVNPEDLLILDDEYNVATLHINVGRNGEIILTTTDINEPDLSKKYLPIEQHCLPIADQGEEVFERFREYDDGYRVMRVEDYEIEDAIKSIGSVKPHVSSCE